MRVDDLLCCILLTRYPGYGADTDLYCRTYMGFIPTPQTSSCVCLCYVLRTCMCISALPERVDMLSSADDLLSVSGLAINMPLEKAKPLERDKPLVKAKLLMRDKHCTECFLLTTIFTDSTNMTTQSLFGDISYRTNVWKTINNCTEYGLGHPISTSAVLYLCRSVVISLDDAYNWLREIIKPYTRGLHFLILKIVVLYGYEWWLLVMQFSLIYVDDAMEMVLTCRKVAARIQQGLCRRSDFRVLLQRVYAIRSESISGFRFAVRYHYTWFIISMALYLIAHHVVYSCDSMLINCSLYPVNSEQTIFSKPHVGGGPRKIRFTARELKPYIPEGLIDVSQYTSTNIQFEYVSHVLSKEADEYLSRHPNDIGCHAMDISLLVSRLTLKDIKKIAPCHGVYVPTRLPLMDVRKLFTDPHACIWDKQYITVFHPEADPAEAKKQYDKKQYEKGNTRHKRTNSLGYSLARQQKIRNKKTEKLNMLRFIARMKKRTLFPPPPPSKELLHKIIADFCADTSPAAFVESGCAVCAELKPLQELTLLADSQCDLGILIGEDVTRVQRHQSSDPIIDIKGPIIDSSCKYICVDCESSLIAGKVPLRSLANGLWIGEVPAELQNLSFAERILIARVQHNRCVMRVSSGRVRMRANAVMFSNPTVKVYHKLPPTLDELDEVLAFVYIGTCKPTEADFQRTPMLVRRNKIANALEWLKLNHCDYADLEISKENLEMYPLNGVPVTVEYNELSENATNQVPGTMSLHDVLEDEGTESGQCPFSVHGMTGMEYADISMNAIKIKALKHLADKGKTLKVGHDDIPQSMHNNPQAYPQMFPWLFPYGLGGIGNALCKGSFADSSHKRHLLMYYDKRFQTDMYFPMIAFNHEQIKGGTTGSLLLAKRAKFDAISNRLLNLNTNVLDDIAKRMQDGEHVKPDNEHEKACFELLDDIDHVGGHVLGSMTSKKYMRNEIWSLISYLGAPSWFITFSPADVAHPICLYFADTDEEFKPEIRSSQERNLLIAQNPVAAAGFFDFMVQMFIKHILGVGKDHPRIYGSTDGYYGTVEQQGRLTLHMHMLLWIRGALSPQEIRNRMMDPTSTFRSEMTAYLESVHVGEFQTGTIADVRSRVPITVEENTGIHETFDPVNIMKDQSTYQNPTQTLPKPPPIKCNNAECNQCKRCKRLDRWWGQYLNTVDDLILRSNVHDCKPMSNEQLATSKRTSKGISDEKINATQRRGCQNKDGVCKARFPREIVPETIIDPSDGSLKVKKLEPNINTLTPAVTYLLRCNSDVTSLLSGTAIKAIVAYISDYVTKQSIKTYQIFWIC